MAKILEMFRFTKENPLMMKDKVWKRHVNPLSVWTRYIVLPLLTVALWSRIFIGWYALIPVGLLILWSFVNPNAFPIPKSTKYWASKAVLGERVWLNRKEIPIPSEFLRMINIINSLGATGAVAWVYGIWALDPLTTVLGLVLVVISKSWFLDRMVWLYEEMKGENEEYASWEY